MCIRDSIFAVHLVNEFLYLFYIRCCLHVSQLEHNFFSQAQNQGTPNLTMPKVGSTNKPTGNVSADKMSAIDRLNLSFNTEDEDEVW